MALWQITPPKDRRRLHHGDKGNDVQALGRLVKRSLKKEGIVSINAQNGVFGDGLLVDVLRFQKLRKIKATGIVNTATWTALDPQVHAFETWLLRKVPPIVAKHGTKLVAVLRRMLILGMPYYSQRRPGARTIAEWDRIGGDCSESDLMADALADGDSYDGYGNTSTIWTTWDHVADGDQEEGDAILYGRNGQTDHVNVVSNVAKRLCIGFGFAPGGEYGWANHHSPIMGFRRSPRSRGGK